MPDIYRSAASVLLFRPTSEGVTPFSSHQLLLLHKPRKKDAWQLPQGGSEQGENAEQTALRELKEEAGLSDVTFIGKSDQVYQYDFPPSYRRFRPDNVCGQRIEYIFALAPADAEVTVDKNEIDRYVWIMPDQLGKYVKRKAYLQLLMSLVEEGMEKLA